MNSFSTWTEIDLTAIEWNTRLVNKLGKALIMAIVKANGYGHGAVEVSKAALSAGAKWIGVARVNEGIELVKNGITAPILVLGPVILPEVDAAIRNGLVLTVYSPDIWEIYNQRSIALGKQVSVHLKLDTGMGRLGLLEDDLSSLLHNVAQSKNIRVDGVYTHLAKAGDIDFTKVQLARFNVALQSLREFGILHLLTHVANSTGTLLDSNLHFDMVRVGAALYGLQPVSDIKLPFDLRPALSWKTQIGSCKTLPPKWGVSYEHEYSNQKGNHRCNTYWLRGWMASLARKYRSCEWRACARSWKNMYGYVYATPTCPVFARTEVVLLGKQGNDVISAEEIASRWGTNSLDVVSTIGTRVHRSFIWT